MAHATYVVPSSSPEAERPPNARKKSPLRPRLPMCPVPQCREEACGQSQSAEAALAEGAERRARHFFLKLGFELCARTSCRMQEATCGYLYLNT